jgi:hypothetical protein
MEVQTITKRRSPVTEAHHTPESEAQLLKTISGSKIRAVEALTAAMRYFSRFPSAALSFASQAAMETRHLAMLTSRLHELGGTLAPMGGTLAPNRYGAGLPDLLPSFNVLGHGSIDALAGFLSDLCLDQKARLLFSEMAAQTLEWDPLSQRILARIARDEREHLASISTLQASVTSAVDQNEVSALLTAKRQSMTRG